jgi:hypothetical protein
MDVRRSVATSGAPVLLLADEVFSTRFEEGTADDDVCPPMPAEEAELLELGLGVDEPFPDVCHVVKVPMSDAGDVRGHR